MVDVSATVVTLNEEDNIRNCLETLTWCDEIIIVDSYSDDATVDIAREYTDKIYTYERTGYSEPAREKALEEASGDWICMIDADERLPDTLVKRLQKIIKENEYDVVYAPRRNYILGEWIDCAGWWPDYRPVLHKPKVTTLSTEIHDFISFSDSATEKYLPQNREFAMIHFNYTGMNDFISRMNKYTGIEAKQMDFSYIKLLFWPIGEFLNRFFIKGGYKKGMIGFYLCVFMAWYRFLSISKSWQQKHIGDENDINEIYDREFNR